MNRVLLFVLSISASGSLLALFLFLIKPLYKYRFSKTWQYYIFLIVVVRLLVPFGFGINLMDTAVDRTEQYFAGQYNSVVFENSDQVAPVINNDPVKEEPNRFWDQAGSTGKIFMKFLWLVWLVPALLLFVWRVVCYLVFTYRIRRSSEPVTSLEMKSICQMVSKSMGIRRIPNLVTNSKTTTPMLIGIWNPVIILPQVSPWEERLSYILRHELTHYKRFDIGYKWLMQAAVCLHWFNPFVLLISREVNSNCELSCDEAVIRQLDRAGQQAYGDMLLESIRYRQGIRSVGMSITLSEDSKLIKERLGAIMNYQKKSKRVIVVSLVLALLVLCAGIFGGGYRGETLVEPVNSESTSIYLPASKVVESVEIESVEMRSYKGSDGHPYVHDVQVNHTDKTITGYQICMLAYDQDGNPLKIDWWSLDTTYDPSFDYFFSGGITELLPGEKTKERGGFSLNFYGTDPEVQKIRYVLYHFREITFEDGSKWTNPNYEQWVLDHRGKKMDVEALENYYPYIQPIE